jgi:hypothetical protein
MYSHWSLHPARIKYREFMRLFVEMSRYRVELKFRELYYWIAVSNSWPVYPIHHGNE